MLLGCIGDDFTGSSDLANTLAQNGMRTVQYSGVPASAADVSVEAGVVALKSRSIPVADAVAQSLAALQWLQKQGCRQFFFKYCSTFDSTTDGNIGPVIDALADELGADRVIVCPAFPGTGRSIYQGHLFVNDQLLNESGMQDHPLTPMTDADIRRWLALQTPGSVGHVAAVDVLQGPDAITTALTTSHDAGCRMIVVDAMRDEDLHAIGASAQQLKLVTGGSGVAMGLPENFRRLGLLTTEGSRWQGQSGKCVALSGSCSSATRAQIEHHSQKFSTREIVASEVIEGTASVTELVDWLVQSEGLPLAFSSADPQTVAAVQERYGRETAAIAIETFFSEVAQGLVQCGVGKILTAGGETSGAIVEALNLQVLEIGPEIDPGVPALRAGPGLVIALKSGNFGALDYFEKAASVLSQQDR